MSATFDTLLFSLYYSPDSIKNIDATIRFEEKEEKKLQTVFSTGWEEALEEEKHPAVAEQWMEEARREDEAEVRRKDIARITQGKGLAPVVTIEEHKYKITYYYLEDMHKFADISKQPAVQYDFIM